MKPSEALGRHREEIRRTVIANRATNPRVFGSVARGEDEDDSDLDILVDPTPDTSLLDIGAIQYKLQALLGVPVDVLTPNAISIKFKDDVLAQAVPV
ncbi:nucleotidyltransferase family protein (plasmid) [Mycetohabitans endofungorum]|uniref:nucleotidyltransferase family protein n=1 Tax=Mycetohabitans endofungorum TaxID=417203 RepID=UPI0030D5BB1F